ncbi:MAG: hypothetical protein LC126_00230 [Bryobacterales bacterium]|nr:hypothetical protein [Bryobacterales bacterium]
MWPIGYEEIKPWPHGAPGSGNYTVTKAGGGLPSATGSNILNEEKQKQVVALGQLGRPPA